MSLLLNTPTQNEKKQTKIVVHRVRELLEVVDAILFDVDCIH